MNYLNYQRLIILMSTLILIQAAYSAEIEPSNPQILGGDEVPIGELEAVGILNGTGVCTATLIEPDLVLTAAHCVCPNSQNTDGCLAQATFKLTDVRPINTPNSRQDISIVGSVKVHPKFATDSNWLSYDFATVKLNQPVSNLALNVNPIPLALPTQRPILGDALTIIGYGTGGNCSSVMSGKRKVTMPLHEILTGNVTLRIGTLSMGACPGDSGGPAINAAGNIVGVASTHPGDYDPTDLAYNWIYPDTFTVHSKGVHGFHLELRDKHQFNLVSAYPLTVNGILNYAWDNVRDPGRSRFIRRLVVSNQSRFPISFRRLIKPISLDKVEHIVEKDEIATVAAKGKHGFHFEMQDKHRFYLESVYPTTIHGRITYEWDNVRDPGSDRFIRRLTVINKSNFPVRFKLKVVRLVLDNLKPALNPYLKVKPVLDRTASVSAKGKHGFHFERQNKHQFYLESVYPTTVNGRITYKWDNVRDPGKFGFIRRLTVTNKSNFPVSFKIKVHQATLIEKPELSHKAQFSHLVNLP